MEILVVEHEPVVGQALMLLLADGATRVMVACDRTTGLRLATDQSYHLILLDGLWPDDDGHSLGAQLRALRPQTPLILLNTDPGPAPAWASAALRKPVAATALVAQVQALGGGEGSLARPPGVAWLSHILDSAVAAVISFRLWDSGDWTYDYVSAGCEPLWGYSPEALMAEPQLWRSRLPPEDLAELQRQMETQLLVHHTLTCEYRFRHRDGSMRWISSAYSAHPIDRHHWQVTAVSHDISDRKQFELTLQRQMQQEYLLNDIAQDIRQSLDLDQVLRRAVERVRALLANDRVIIFRLQSEGTGKVIAEAVDERFTAILAATIHDPCFCDRYVAPYRQGRVAAVADIATAAIEPCYRQLLQGYEVKANLVVPILQGDNLWGLLIAHQCATPRQWAPAEIALLKRIATQTSIAIQQSELYGQMRQELQERERIQRVLEASEARFRSLSAAAPIGICQVDTEGRCTYTNARWQQISGLSAGECLGHGWRRGLHPDDQNRFATAWGEYLEGGGDRQPEFRLPEFRLLTPDGDLRWIAAQVAPMRSANGEIIGYVSTHEDITERKEADRTIREQAALLDIAADAISVRDLDHRILYWNQGAERLYGWPAAEALGQKAHDLLRSETDQHTDIFATLLSQGEWRGELTKYTQTHQTLTVAARWTLGRDEADQPQFILAVETDITEKKTLEAQFYQAQRLDSLGLLASGIAHDLNNVFTPILALAQLLRLTQTSLGPQPQEHLRLIEDSAKRGASMVQQILAITRRSSGNRMAVNLVPLLQDLGRMLQQSLPKTIDLRWPVWGAGALPLPPVSADPTHLHQVLMNLCVNARDAMPEGGTLTLTTEVIDLDAAAAEHQLDAQAGSYVRITVADTGTGIAPEVRDRIFDPFFTTKPPGQGTGLGLATVMGLVKASGGFVQVSSQVDQGTHMQVYLPALAHPTGDRPGVAAPAALPLGQGEKILVVDDDPAVLEAVRSLLASHHYHTLGAQDGAEALVCAAQHHQALALVVLDMMMPGMDGLALLQRLRANHPHIQVIATSGLPVYQAQALAAGAQAFLPKPYDFGDLLKTVAALLPYRAPLGPNP